MDVRKELERTVRHLVEVIGPRPPGSAPERRAAEYLATRFHDAGLNAEICPFPSASDAVSTASLKLPDGLELPACPTQFSAAGDVRGPLVFLGSDGVPRQDMAVCGAIGLLIPQGSHHAKIALLQQLESEGLAGLIVVSPGMDTVVTKIVRFPEIQALPIATISCRAANALASHVGEQVHLRISHTDIPAGESANVVAELPGTGPHWLAVSAHMDTAPHCPGALDNAGGAATLIELARSFAGATLPASLRFIATGSEEYGRTDGVGAGAQAYCDTHAGELANCIGWVEIDDVGNRLGDLHVYIGGRKPFRDAVRTVPAPAHTRFPGKATTGCDHGAAEQRGLPTVWFTDAAAIPRPHYHTPEDTMAFMDTAKAASYITYIGQVIGSLASNAAPTPTVREGDRLLRQATCADLDAISEITRLAFEPVSFDRMREDFFGEELGGKPWHHYKCGGLVNAVRNNIYQALVTEIDGVVVAYATYILDAGRGIGTIGNNAVHPDVQGRGIGKMQQREVDRLMREEGVTRFQVTTLTNDIPAQKLYEKLGYKRIVGSINYLRQD